MTDLQQWLKDATQHFEMQLAIISHIDGSRYRVIEAYSSLGLVQQGDEFVVDATYCREVVKQSKTVAYQRVGAITEMCLHPCYQALHLESYIGTPIKQAGCIVGTLNFSSLAAREQPFSMTELQDIEALAREYQEIAVAG